MSLREDLFFPQTDCSERKLYKWKRERPLCQHSDDFLRENVIVSHNVWNTYCYPNTLHPFTLSLWVALRWIKSPVSALCDSITAERHRKLLNHLVVLQPDSVETLPSGSFFWSCYEFLSLSLQGTSFRQVVKWGWWKAWTQNTITCYDLLPPLPPPPSLPHTHIHSIF